MPRGIWINPTNAGRHLEDVRERRTQITRAIDRNGFDWQVWAVASSGFFTDSYNLFATNVILPSLAFVYWPHATTGTYETIINIVTLVGSMFGQLTFGFLADRFGRRKLYGLELIVVIVATIGVAQSSNGVAGPTGPSMEILGWIIFWRLLVGIGIGAEYPLSAVITAEFAPVQQRAKMMAAVFLMQPLGQLVASLVGLGAVMGIGKTYGLDQLTNSPEDYAQSAVIVDRIWRVVIGVGAIPALVAIIFRITIPESPRFTLDVENDAKRALTDTQIYYQTYPSAPSTAMGTPLDDWDDSRPPTAQRALRHSEEANDDEADALGWGSVEADSLAIEDSEQGGRSYRIDSAAISGRKPSTGGSQFTKEKIYDYFITQGNWRYLAGTSMCWFLLDFAFYGLGINNPRTIAAIWEWAPLPANVNTSIIPDWESNTGVINQTIYDNLIQDAKQSAITVSIGSVIGSLALLKAIDYLPRKNFLAWSFLVLAALFVITGGSYYKAFQTNLHAMTIVFYVLCQLVFNFGPNTLTFIIPAEIFPTRYRCTCHGISAASGKFGSILVQLVLTWATFDGHTDGDPRFPTLFIILLVFSVLMALGSVFAWVWLPELQELRRGKGLKLPSKTLEELAGGRAATGDRAPGFRKKMGAGKLRQRQRPKERSSV